MKKKHKSPIAELVHSLKTDEGYYIGWKANIAMAFFDEARRKKAKISRKNLHEIANTAADNFLQLLMK